MMRRPSTAGTFTLAALSLTMLAGCGGGDESPDDAAAPSSAAKAPSPEDELARRILTQGEVTGYKIDKPETKYAIAKDQKGLDVAKPACAPAAYAMNHLPIGDPQATLTREVDEKDFEGMSTSLTLSSYAAGEAEAAMAGLEEAVKSCPDGFDAKGTGGTNTYGSTSPEAAPGYGDQSLAFTAAYTVKGATQTFRTEAARFGDTVVIYFTYDGDALLRSVPGSGKIPAAVVKAQNAKLTG